MTGCSSCGLDNPPTSRFCGRCGQPLQDRTGRERRQLTVMFCDLVGSTALAEKLDPEDLSDLILAYYQAAAGAVAEFDGNVAQHLGDGLLVYFGYPVAHEDDARRAVYAGLRILEAIALLNGRLDPVRRLSLRIGIHTGPAVTGDFGSGTTQEHLALGSTPNVAARLQGIADPDTVVVSGDTHELVKHACRCEPLATPTLKGLSQPISVYRVIAQARAPELIASTEMVDRREELERLWEAFETAQKGRCAAVMVTAEAGLGKTRLVHELRARVEGLAGDCWVVHCSPYEQASALRPVISLIQGMFGLRDEQAPPERLAALVSALESVGALPSETLSLLAGLLSVPLPQPFAPLELTPQKRKELTLEALASLVVRKSQRQPVILWLEDLHWAGPSTLDFLGLLMSRAASAPLLLLMTARPTLTNPWGDCVTSVALKPLDRPDSNAIVTRVAGGRALPARLLDEIIERTDGVPLFVEELTKMILESGALRETVDGYVEGESASVSIPTSLQASLTARLDRLGAAKRVAQLGSVIGREFGIEMLRTVAPWDEDALLGGLRRLIEADLVYQQEAAPQVRYSFKHALAREA